MPELYSVTEIVGKDLFALNSVDVLNLDSSFAYTVSKGDRVGTVFSYLERDASIYWLLNDGSLMVKHETGLFDVEALNQQGATSTEEKLTPPEGFGLSSLFSSEGSFNVKKIRTAIIVITVIIALVYAAMLYRGFKLSKSLLIPAS